MATPVLSIRLSADERRLLEGAAARSRRTIGDFVRRRALDAAELELTERREIVLSAEGWARFEAFAKRPARRKAALARLAASKPVWEK